jgi:hypothetical protein
MRVICSGRLVAPALRWLRRGLFARFNRGTVAQNVAHQPFRLGALDERGVYALGELSIGELAKGTRKH